jgi:hypothetical protein
MKPYVISADIFLLMEKWASQSGFLLPSEKFFSDLRENFLIYLRKIFHDVEFVSENEICEGLSNFVDKIGLPTISLDRVYLESDMYLDLARQVDERGKDLGLGRRFGTQSIFQQVQNIKRSGISEVMLIDDVIFSGSFLERIITLLLNVGINVPVICAGVGVLDGVKRLNKVRDVYCVRIYENLIDEVCERDFYPGVCFSGRPVFGSQNVSMPYILPFGKPEEWASIPKDYVEDFSRFCIYQTKSLFEEVEKCSEKKVLCMNIATRVVGLEDEMCYTDALRKLLN